MEDSERVKKKRVNVEDDRLSNLPDDLIHKILSLISMKQAIETSGLSRRWRLLWKSMPYLNFSVDDFSCLYKFSRFVFNVLSHRNNLVEVYSVKLIFHGEVKLSCVIRIFNYANSHNVQRVDVVCLAEDTIEFPLSLFDSQSLKHLRLTNRISGVPSNKKFLKVVPTWNLPALTTLHLDEVTLFVDDIDKSSGIISKCVNLKNLTLKLCRLIGSNVCTIFHSGLSELTLESVAGSAMLVNVVTPRLKKLSIRRSSRKIMISAPDLAYLLINVHNHVDLSTDGFRSLEMADIRISSPNNPIETANLLQVLHSVKDLTLNLEIFELLSSSVELISHKPSPFVNLKSVKVYPVTIYDWELTEEKPTVFTELKKYLLDSSPSASFTMILREDILVERLMAELGELLEHEKDTIDTNWDLLEQEETPIARDSEEMSEPGESEPETDNEGNKSPSWTDEVHPVEKRRGKAGVIIWKLEDIEKVLRKMSVSKRAVIQPCVSKLLADAEIIMNKIIDYLKDHCDENHIRLNDRFHELFTSLQRSS